MSNGTVIFDHIYIALQTPQDPSLPAFLEACRERNHSLIAVLAEGRDRWDGSLTQAVKIAFESDHIDVAACLLQNGAIADTETLL